MLRQEEKGFVVILREDWTVLLFDENLERVWEKSLPVTDFVLGFVSVNARLVIDEVANTYI